MEISKHKNLAKHKMQNIKTNHFGLKSRWFQMLMTLSILDENLINHLIYFLISSSLSLYIRTFHSKKLLVQNLSLFLILILHI